MFPETLSVRYSLNVRDQVHTRVKKKSENLVGKIICKSGIRKTDVRDFDIPSDKFEETDCGFKSSEPRGGGVPPQK